MNAPILIKGNDYSAVTIGEMLSEGQKLDLKEYFQFNQYPTPENLGLFYNKSKDNQLTASRYAGAMPLTAQLVDEKENSKKILDNGSYVMIAPRFEASATEMLKYIVESDDFYQTTCNGNAMVTFATKKSAEWKEKTFSERETSVLFGTYSDLKKIKFGSEKNDSNHLDFGDLQGIFEIMEFLPACQRVCQQNLKQQSIRREENLVGKMKGKLNLQKQIKHNITSGRVDRNYCTFNQMSIDNKENRILKYALYLLGQAKSAYPNLLEEEFAFCQRALSPVKLEACNLSDFNGLKNNGVFQYYAPALEAAKKIITRISVTFGGDGKSEITLSKDVTPFFIQMDLLFELFCRAVVGNCLKKMNIDMKKYTLLPYQKKFDLFKGESVTGFANTHIPDLVIMENEKPVAIIDAKYSQLNSGGDRERTFQIMTYMLRLNCKKGGFMSPLGENEFQIQSINIGYGQEEKVPEMFGFHLPIDAKMTDNFESTVQTNLKSILGEKQP